MFCVGVEDLVAPVRWPACVIARFKLMRHRCTKYGLPCLTTAPLEYFVHTSVSPGYNERVLTTNCFLL